MANAVIVVSQDLHNIQPLRRNSAQQAAKISAIVWRKLKIKLLILLILLVLIEFFEFLNLFALVLTWPNQVTMEQSWTRQF